MKKWLTFLLFIVTTIASFYPCCDEDQCGADNLISTTTEQGKKSNEGTCSPFISCGTCPGFTQLAKAIEVPTIEQVKPVHHSRVQSSPLPSYTSSLLQPPKAA